MRSRRWLLLGLAGAALLLLLGRGIAALYVDYRWYAMMGATRLWRVQIVAGALARGLSFALGTLFALANLYAVRHSVVSLVLPRRVANLEIGEEVPGRYLLGAVIGLSLLVGALLTMGSASWMPAALLRYGLPFNESDPYFQADFGFFVYWLPFERALYYWALFAVILVTAVVVFLYALTPSLRWERGALRVSTYVRRHLSVLGALMLLVLAWSFRLDRFDILGHGSGPAGAVTAVDYRYGIPVNLVLSLFSLVVAVVVLWAGWFGRMRTAFVLVTGVLVASFVAHQVLPGFVEQWIGDQDERLYLATRAGYTRRAYGVERLVLADSAASQAFPSLAAARRGVSVWDAAALQHALAPGTPDRQHLGWAVGPAGLEAFLVDRTGGAEGGRAQWSLQGVLATAADERGTPIPVDSLDASAVTDRGALAPVHFADSLEGYAIVADSARRLAAVELSSGLSRLAHAWSLQNVHILTGDLPEPAPRILLHRDVRERVRALAPYFAQGSALAPVLSADTLYWALDLYSASDGYPLSERYELAGDERSYFQHAATALVNATTGRVLLVADSTLDPIAESWVRLLPGLFVRADRLPPRLLALLPPPLDGAIAQARAFGRYGTRLTAAPPRHLPFSDGADTVLAGAPPTPLALPDGAIADVLPLLDENERVQGVILARGGAQRASVWLPARVGDARWPLVTARLRGESADSAPARRGGVTRGAVRVIPVADRLVFLQSAYTWRGAGASPLEHVAILAGDTLRVGRSLADALGVEAGGPAAPAATEQPGALGRARSLYETMRDALRRGDWRAFGDAFDQLGRLLARSPR